MFTALKRLFTDEVYFAQQLRALVFLLGTLMFTGVIDLGTLQENLGPIGWYVGIVLQAAALFVRAGEKNGQAPTGT